MQKKYDIIDRYQLAARNNKATPDWVRDRKKLDPLVRDYGYLQHDIMFGKARTLERFFPKHDLLAERIPGPMMAVGGCVPQRLLPAGGEGV